MCHHTETEHLDIGREEGAEHRTSMCEGSCYFEQIFIEMWLTSVAHGSVVGVGGGGLLLLLLDSAFVSHRRE